MDSSLSTLFLVTSVLRSPLSYLRGKYNTSNFKDNLKQGHTQATNDQFENERLEGA